MGSCPTGRGPWIEVPWDWERPVGRSQLEVSPAAASSCFRSGDKAAAHDRYLDAVALEGQGAPRDDVAAALEKAVALDPTEASYSLLLGALRLSRGHFGAADALFRLALEHERHPFPRSQLLLLASRCAEVAGHRDRARALREELFALEHPLALDNQAQARREQRRPLSARAARRVAVNLVFPDVARV